MIKHKSYSLQVTLKGIYTLFASMVKKLQLHWRPKERLKTYLASFATSFNACSYEGPPLRSENNTDETRKSNDVVVRSKNLRINRVIFILCFSLSRYL